MPPRPKSAKKAKPLPPKVGIQDVVDPSISCTRASLIADYQLREGPLKIPISQVVIVAQDDSKLNLGFPVSTLRAKAGTNPTFAGYMGGNGWDPARAGMVQMMATQAVIDAYGKFGPGTEFREWCVDQIVNHGANLLVVDGVHRTDWLQTNETTCTFGWFTLICATCPTQRISYLAATANNIKYVAGCFR